MNIIIRQQGGGVPPQQMMQQQDPSNAHMQQLLNGQQGAASQQQGMPSQEELQQMFQALPPEIQQQIQQMPPEQQPQAIVQAFQQVQQQGGQEQAPQGGSPEEQMMQEQMMQEQALQQARNGMRMYQTGGELEEAEYVPEQQQGPSVEELWKNIPDKDKDALLTSVQQLGLESEEEEQSALQDMIRQYYSGKESMNQEVAPEMEPEIRKYGGRTHNNNSKWDMIRQRSKASMYKNGDLISYEMGGKIHQGKVKSYDPGTGNIELY